MNTHHDTKHSNYKGAAKKTSRMAARQWTSGLCEPSCTCVGACFLPCVVFASNVSLMEKNNFNSIPVIDVCMPPCTSLCSKPICGMSLYGVGTVGMYLNTCFTFSGPFGCLFSMAQCVSIFTHMKVRNKIRKQYNISPDCCKECCDGECGDFLSAMFCYSCALAQENRMLENRKPSDVSATDPPTQPNFFDGVRMDSP